MIRAVGVAVEAAEHPLQRSRAGRPEPQLLSELIELGRVPQVRGEIDACWWEAEIHADRSRQCRSVAADEDVTVHVAADGCQLGRAEVPARGQVVKARLVAEFLGDFQIDGAAALSEIGSAPGRELV